VKSLVELLVEVRALAIAVFGGWILFLESASTGTRFTLCLANALLQSYREAFLVGSIDSFYH